MNINPYRGENELMCDYLNRLSTILKQLQDSRCTNNMSDATDGTWRAVNDAINAKETAVYVALSEAVAAQLFGKRE